MSRDPLTHSVPERPVLLETLQALTEGVALFDRDANLVFVNDSFRRMNVALESTLAPGLSWGMFLLEAAQKEVLSKQACNALERMEGQLLDGMHDLPPVACKSPHGVSFSLALLPTSDDGFVLTQTVTIDPDLETDSAKQADLLLSKVLEACPANLIMSRIGDGQIIYRSPSATQLLGRSRSSFDHFARREDRADFITALLPDARVEDMRFEGLYPDGTSFPAKISARLIDYNDEEVIVANITDITREIQLQQKLERQREQLFQSEKMSALGELLAGVAHELNNPLSIVVGNAVMLKEDISNPADLRRVEKITDAAERCVRIVRSFLAMARKEPIDIQPVDLPELVRSAVGDFWADDTRRKFRTEVTADDTLPPARIDPVQITQVILNLLTNAHQAMDASGTGDTIRISVTRIGTDDRLIVDFRDNGPGIPANIRSRVFDPLFTTKSIGKGTGVGLALCHRIVASHGGAIRLGPPSNAGAQFIVELPVWDEAD